MRRYNLISLACIFIVAVIVITFQPAFIAIDGDLTYHLSAAQSFVRDGGVTLLETWDSLPLGRPHMYPPVVHLFLSVLVALKVSSVSIIHIFNVAAIVGLLLVGWEGIRRLFSAKVACMYMIVASSFMIYVKLIGVTVPASLVLVASPFLLVLIKKNKIPAAVALLAVLFYTHMVFPWFVVAAFFIWGFYHRKYFKTVCRVILWAVVLYLPWLIHVLSNLEYLRYFHESYPAIVTATTLYSANFSMILLWLMAILVLAHAWRKGKGNTDLVYFLALSVVSLPVAYFEFSRYIYSIGIWPMMVMIAYAYAVHVPQEKSVRTRRMLYGLLVVALVFSVYAFNNNGRYSVQMRNHLLIQAFVPPAPAYLGKVATPHFNWDNFIISDLIEANSPPGGVIYSLAHRLDNETYADHRIYVLPQLFTALTGRRMANLRSPEHHWQEWMNPLATDILMVNRDQIDEAGMFIPSFALQIRGIRPFDIRSNFRLIAHTREGFEVYARNSPSISTSPAPQLAMPLWLGWLILLGFLAYIVYSVLAKDGIEYKHKRK